MKTEKRTGTLMPVLKKELFLATPLPVYLFALLGLMTLIPDYPSIVGIGYIALALFTVDGIRRGNRDIEFTSALPVKRESVVSAKALFVVILEMLFIFFAGLGGSVSRYFISPDGNIVGLDANLTFFGVALLALGAFNACYLPLFFRTGYKSGVPVIVGLVAFIFVYSIAELCVNLIPGASLILDGYSAEFIYARALVLGISVILYTALTVLSTVLAQKSFERVSL